MQGPETQIQLLASREYFREQYGLRRDPVRTDRLFWRAQAFRHLTHLLPGQSVLELGAGQGSFLEQLETITRGRNPITAVTFQEPTATRGEVSSTVDLLYVNTLPGPLEGCRFRSIVCRDLLDGRNCAWLLDIIYRLLEPGGQVIFFESNPWNLILRLRRLIGRWIGHNDSRMLLSRRGIYELISEIGFVKILALYSDFVYAPLNRPLIWLLRNLSILLENMPGVQTLAGSIVISGHKPGAAAHDRTASLAEHEQLYDAVSVVIPCHNEAMNVERTVRRLYDLYAPYLHEIVLVDDNSTDDTAAVIRSLAGRMPLVKPVFRNPPNGVGRALLDGYCVTTGKYVLSLDCDFVQLLPEIRDLFDAALEGYDVVIGSRFSRHSVLLNYPFKKIIANRAFHLLAQMAFHRRFRDVTNNLKLLRQAVVQNLQLSEPGFAVNAETGLQPMLMGYSVHEVPMSWINRTPDMGTSSFRLAKVGGGYWRVLARLTLRTRFGLRPLDRKRRAVTSVVNAQDAAHTL